MLERKISLIVIFSILFSLIVSPGLFAFDFGDFSSPPSDFSPPSGFDMSGPPSGWSDSYTGPMGPGGPSLGPNGPMGLPPGFTPPTGGMPDISGAQQAAIQQAMQQMQAGMSAAQQQAMEQAMQQAMQFTGIGAMPDFSKLGTDIDYNKLPTGTIPEGLIPPGGFKPGEIPSQALPPGFSLPAGMELPPNIPVQFDLNAGTFTGPYGETIQIPKLGDLNLPKAADGLPIVIPQLTDGRVIPLPVGSVGAIVGGGVAGSQRELKSVLGLDIKTDGSIDPTQFASTFNNMDMTKLNQLSAESLDALYQNADAQKLDISDPKVQTRMEEIYQARNKQFGVGEIEDKLDILNANIPEVLNVSVESLDKQIASLQAMQAAGNNSEKVTDALAKCIDAKNSQLRANGIYQQIADLKNIQQTMVARGQSILTSIGELGLQFTAQEQMELENEIQTMGEGTVPGLPGKIQALQEKYAAKIQASNAVSGDFIKLATVYEKAGDMAKAHEVLSQALAVNPDDDGIITTIASLNMEAKEYDKAAAVVEGMLKKNPLPQTRALYSEIKEKQGDIPTAVTYMEKAIKDAPQEDAFYQQVGQLYTKDGKPDDFSVFSLGEKVAFDTPPTVINDRTLVPIRALAESMGSQVDWNAQTNQANITLGGKEIQLTLNSKNAIVNGQQVTLDVPATRIDNRILVPLRFVGESFDKQVDYIPEGKVIAVQNK